MFKKVALSIASVAVAGSVLFASQTVTEAAYYPVQKLVLVWIFVRHQQ